MKLKIIKDSHGVCDYIFQYHTDDLKFEFCIELPNRELSDYYEFLDKLKNNGLYSLKSFINNDMLSLSTENGFTSFYILKNGEYQITPYGSSDFTLKNELCIDAIEEWINHFKVNYSGIENIESEDPISLN